MVMKFHSLLLAFVLALIFSGCNEKVLTELEIGTGKECAYIVDSSVPMSVADTVTGLSFYFPSGGDGLLTITEVTDAPKLPVNAKKFLFDYSGNEPVEIHLPWNEEEYGFLFVYGPSEEKTEEDSILAWRQVREYSETDDSLVYYFNGFPDSQKAKRVVINPFKLKTYAYSVITKNSAYGEKWQLLNQSLREVIDTWIEFLPQQEATRVRNGLTRFYRYRVNINFGGGSSYTAADHYFSTDYIFEFDLGQVSDTHAELRTLAHEVGHYMTDVLFGRTFYNELINNFPDVESHSPGMLLPRNASTLEDYAYFSEYLITGAVDQMDYTNVSKRNNFRDLVDNKANPSDIDYPGSEGFSTVMLVSLIREADKVYPADRGFGQSLVPVCKASIEEVIGVLLNHPRTVDETREHIQTFLESKGDKYKTMLPAMLEPIGWSYNGKGRVVDKDGDPVKNARVIPIVYADNKEYRSVESTRTGTDGEFYLPRLFPGNSFLRIFLEDDSTELPLTINWNLPTNQQIILGDLILGENTGTEEEEEMTYYRSLSFKLSTMSVLQKKDKTSVSSRFGNTSNHSEQSLIWDLEYKVPTVISEPEFILTSGDGELKWSGNSFTWQATYTKKIKSSYTQTITISSSGTFDGSIRKLLVFTRSYKSETTANGSSDMGEGAVRKWEYTETSESKFSIKNVSSNRTDDYYFLSPEDLTGTTVSYTGSYHRSDKATIIDDGKIDEEIQTTETETYTLNQDNGWNSNTRLIIEFSK
jgi:hypothetical protein